MKSSRIIFAGLMCNVVSVVCADIASVQYVRSVLPDVSQADWNQTTATAPDFIKNKPTLGTAASAATTDFATATQGALADTAVQPGDLATVATSGSYNDLTNKPTLPTVNDATLTIQKNGTAVDTFTANAATNKTINITVPTTAAEVGAVPTTRTVNSKALSSDITLTASDVGAEATANKSTSSTYATDLANNSKKDVNYPTLAAAEQIAINAAADAAASIVDSISEGESAGNVVVSVFANDGAIGVEKGYVFDSIDVTGEGSVVTSIGQGDDDNVIVATMGSLTASDVGADATGTAAGLVGTLSNLTTTDKTNVVAAINEVKSSIGNIDTGVESVTEGTANGTIAVDGTDVAVHGLGTAAYTASTDYVPTSRTVNGSALSSDVTLTGANVAVTGYTKPATTSAIAATDTVNQAIGKLEKAILPVGTAAETVAAGNDGRFDTVPTTQPSGTPATGRAFIWFD